jgi:hypothetical protein
MISIEEWMQESLEEFKRREEGRKKKLAPVSCLTCRY